MEKIQEIKDLFAKAEKEQWHALFSQYEKDERAGVQELIKRYRKKLLAEEKEERRLEKMLEFEKKYGNEYTCICGIAASVDSLFM